MIMLYTYKGKVTRVVDGDTYDINCDLGFSLQLNHRFRLRNFDTPEITRPSCEAEKLHGRQAKEFVRMLVEGKDVYVQSFKLGIYGRYVADIFLINPDGSLGDSLATLLANEGLEKRKDYSEVVA